MHTILLIDSCPLTRECLSAILRAKGYRVQSCALISQAKSMITKNKPDLVISEIRLPDDNAINLMRTLQSEPDGSKIKFCVLTQAAAKKPILEAIELGAIKVMLKTKFSIAGFLAQIEEIFSAPSGSGNSQSDVSLPSETRYPIPMPALDPALQLKDIKPIVTRKYLSEKLDELEDLCTMSEPISRLIQEIDSPENNLEEIADILKLDQAIAMKVMKIASSSVYSRSEATQTLKDAVVRIGLEQLREIVVSVGVIDKMTTISSSHVSLDPIAFWEHSLCVALCSSKIAARCNGIQSEVAFTAAILHDIGRQVLVQTMPEAYTQVLQCAQQLGIGLDQAEKRMMLCEHTSIAQNLLHSWNLPKDLVEAIGHHHELPSKLSTVCPKNAQLAATVSLANCLTHAYSIGDSGNHLITASEELISLLEIEDFSIRELFDGLSEELCTLRALFFSSESNGSLNNSLSSAPAPMFDQSFRPIYITMNEDHDAIGHWVNSIRDSSMEPANVAIVHLRQPKDRLVLASKLEAALSPVETSNSAMQKIPLLMLSPTGKTALADEIITARPSLHLRTPISRPDFERAINMLLNGTVRPDEGWSGRRAG